MNLTPRPAAVALLLSLVACEAPVIGNGVRHGVVSFAAKAAGGATVQEVLGGFVIHSTAVPDFFARDTCVVAQVSGETWNYVPRDRDLERSVGGVYTNSLTAGSPVRVLSAGRSDVLSPRLGASGFEYVPTTPPDLPIAPGDSFTLEIPGELGGFPAATLHGRLAEPITLDTATAGDALRVTWDQAPEAGARTLTVMRLKSAPAADAPLFDIVCSFPDTGEALVPPDLAATFWNSPDGYRQFNGRRVRFHAAALDAKTTLFVISTHWGVLGTALPALRLPAAPPPGNGPTIIR